MEKYTNYETLLDEDNIEKVRKKANGNILLETLAIRLRTAMLKQKLNQADVVKLTGIGKASISSYINAEAEPKTSYLIKLAECLGVSVNYLLGEHKNSTVENEDIRKKLGLTDEAINSLKGIKDEKSKRNEFLYGRLKKKGYSSVVDVSKITNIYILNELLDNKLFANDFLEIVSKYIGNIHGVAFHNSLTNNDVDKMLKLNDDVFKQNRNEALFQMQNILVQMIDDISNKVIIKEKN